MALRAPGSAFSVARRLSERARAARAADKPAQDSLAGLAGLGGMLDALRGLVEKLSEASPAPHASPDEAADAQTHEINIGGRTASVVFGYTLRRGEDGISAERFGDVPEPRAERPARPSNTARQPIAEVFEENDEIVVVAELPGADPTRITCTVRDGALLIAASGRQHYHKSLPLPARVASEAPRTSFQNGILEVRLQREHGA